MTARQRQLRFINTFGPLALDRAVKAAFDRRGPDWLTDDQIEDITNDLIRDHRSTQRRNRQNRQFYARAHG